MKKVSWLLAVLMLLSVVFGCTATPAPAASTPTEAPAATVTEAPKATEASAPTEAPAPEPEAEPVKEPAVYNSVEGFHDDTATEGVWQYYYSIDDGATVTDPCEDYTDYGGYGGWHPWEGSYVGVGFNHDVEGYLEFNTDQRGGLMGVLVFEAPADGKYVVTAQIWNPWEQDLDSYTVKNDKFETVVEQSMDELVDVYGFITPTDVEMKTGEKLYFMCNSKSESWASAYSNVTIYYEPQDESVYVIPEVVMPVKEVVGVDPDFEQEAKWNAVKDFDRTAADGSNTPWVYATTVAWGEFAINEKYEEQDWDGDGKADANQWYSADGTGMGFNFNEAYGGNYLELNTTDYGATVSALGFKAPAAGTYAFNGYVMNIWGANANMLRVYKGSEYYKDFAAKEYKEKPNEFAFTAKLEEGEIVWLFVDSEGGWVSSALSVFVNEAEDAPVVEVNLLQDAKWAAYRDFDRTAADGSNTPWIYATTVAWGEFTTNVKYDEPDWDGDGAPNANQWYSEDGTGMGVSFSYDEGYLELNTTDYGATVSCLGFKAPAAGTYAFNGYVRNPWGQSMNLLRVYKNADYFADFPAGEFVDAPNAFDFEVELAEGDIVWVFVDSNGGWVSAAVALFVNEK